MAEQSEALEHTGDGSLDKAAATLKGLFADEPARNTNSPDNTDDTPADEADDNTARSQADQADDSETDDSEADTQAEVETIGADQLANLLKTKPDAVLVNDEGEIRFKVNIDGETRDANLTELLERYQRDAHLTNRGKELSELKKQSESKLSELMTLGQQMAQQNSLMFDALSKEVLSRYDDVNWTALRAEDPAEFAAKRAEMNEITNRINSVRDSTMQQVAAHYQALQQQSREKFQQYLAEQRDAVKTMIPEWGPETQKNLKNYLNSQGFVDNEVNSVFDARMVNIVHKAMLFDKGKAKISDKLEKKPLPKVLKPGAKPDARQLQTESQRKAKAKLRKSGSVEDAAGVLKQMFKS